MTITNGYATLAELKAENRLNITVETFDTSIEGIIEAISREIDKETARFFYIDTSDVTRYFTAKEINNVLIGDWVSITTLSVDDAGDRVYRNWTVDTDYDLWPYDANSDGKPYQAILIGPNSSKSFGVDIGKGVKIVGKRGWPSVPKPVKEACILWSMRAYKRYATPLGMSAMTALGQMQVKVPPPDPDVMFLLSPYTLQYIG